MDLYNIPGDTGGHWRLDKFVEYQHEAPSIHYRMLGEYIKRYVKDKDDAVMMCWYMSATYNEVTCVLLLEILDWKNLTPDNLNYNCRQFWHRYKQVLDFGSSRKYAKNMDWFPELIKQFIRLTKKHPFRWLMSQKGGSPQATYHSIYSSLKNLKYTGRFAVDLFMESVMYLQDYFGIEIQEPIELDWKHCANLTSGLLNIFYLDEEANFYDKKKSLPSGITEEFLSNKLEIVQKYIQNVYPEQDNDINMFIGKICSFRNLFKSARYGGFHHDRELGVIKQYEALLPEYTKLWKRLYKLRRSMFDERFLGELHDWNGIRKERKKLWLTKGLTGVERGV